MRQVLLIPENCTIQVTKCGSIPKFVLVAEVSLICDLGRV